MSETVADYKVELVAWIKDPGTLHPDGLPCVCVQAILDHIATDAVPTNLTHWDTNADEAT